MQLKIVQSLLNRLSLLITQGISNDRFLAVCDKSTVLLKVPEHRLRLHAANLKPLVILALLTLNLIPRKISMKISIPKCITRAVIIDGSTLPLLMPLNIGSMSLLIDTGIYVLLRITNLSPAIMPLNLRSRIGIDHRHRLGAGLNLRSIISHHAISLTLVSIKSISSADKPYFL